MSEKTIWIDYAVLGLGQTVFAYYEGTSAAPLGLVWGAGSKCPDGLRFDVMGSFVEPDHRRKGIRTLINDRIFEIYDYDVITTWQGSKDGGNAFLKAYGYRYNKQALIWSVTKRQRERVKRAQEKAGAK